MTSEDMAQSQKTVLANQEIIQANQQTILNNQQLPAERMQHRDP